MILGSAFWPDLHIYFDLPTFIYLSQLVQLCGPLNSNPSDQHKLKRRKRLIGRNTVAVGQPTRCDMVPISMANLAQAGLGPGRSCVFPAAPPFRSCGFGYPLTSLGTWANSLVLALLAQLCGWQLPLSIGLWRKLAPCPLVELHLHWLWIATRRHYYLILAPCVPQMALRGRRGLRLSGRASRADISEVLTHRGHSHRGDALCVLSDARVCARRCAYPKVRAR